MRCSDWSSTPNASSRTVAWSHAARICPLVILAVLWAGAAPHAALDAAGGAGQTSGVVSAAAVVEDALLRELNAERTGRDLQPVRMLPELSTVARAHSTEMASHGYFAHDSSRGRTAEQRLMDAGIVAVRSGENLSRSTTSDAAPIVKSWLGSPSHRAILLDPSFDAIGIGVAADDVGLFYVTADYVQTFSRKSAAEVRQLVLEALNLARRESGLPPITLAADVNRLADQAAAAKARNGEVPQIPLIGKRSPAMFLTGIDLEDVTAKVRALDVKGFGSAGVGSTFASMEAFPKGAYVVCVILVWDGL